MGTLAQTLGRHESVEVGGMSVNVNQLSVDELFSCMRDAFKKFEERDKPIDQMAQEAIESGRIPLTSISIIIAKACPSLDAEDVKVLLTGDNMDHALKICATAMGTAVADEPEKPKKGAPKKRGSAP